VVFCPDAADSRCFNFTDQIINNPITQQEKPDMAKIIPMSFLICTMLITSNLHAQMPPSSEEVANTVSNLWMQRDFTGMSNFVTNLYMAYSNYVPAIMASAFHDHYFCGDIATSTNKLVRVRDGATNWPSGYAHAFLDVLGSRINWAVDESRFFEERGVSEAQQKQNASPQAVREYVGDHRLPIPIYYLFWAPNTNVWHESN